LHYFKLASYEMVIIPNSVRIQIKKRPFLH